MQVEDNKKFRFNILILISCFLFFTIETKANKEKFSEYECLLENSASGLFQNKRKFLKDTMFFSYKTLMIFSDNFTLLKEKDNTFKRESEAKYQFDCKKNKEEYIVTCVPKNRVNAYQIKFSLKTLRYKKTYITDYWIAGKGNEVDYLHIAHGYCYSIEN